MIDSHCHIHFRQFRGHILKDRMKLWVAQGVKNLVVNACHPEEWPEVLELSRMYPAFITPSLGVHPWHANRALPTDWESELVKLLRENERAGVGECGLDKGKRGEGVPYDMQVDVMRKQLEIARALDRPVSIHCVNAYTEMMEILQSYPTPFTGGIMFHSYQGSSEQVSQFHVRGKGHIYFSFSLGVTDPKRVKLHKAVSVVPRDRLLIETDSPDQLPHSFHEGAMVDEDTGLSVNEPSNLANIVTAIASIRGEAEGKIMEITTENAARLFRI